jgi:MoaA/NifB/PqqE/SkfB family radical SAM enzyme
MMREYAARLRQLWRQASFPIQQEGVLYHCPLTLRKRHNLALQQVNKQLLHRRDVVLPHILHVGVTTLCNLRCPGCPTGTKALGRKGEHLDFDLYCRVVDELRHTLMFMLFWDWGEPFLHPRLADMIRHAKKSGIKTVVSTNGTTRNSREQIENLVAAQPDVVIVCIDGATQESYSAYRVGGKLDTALATIRRLAESKRKLQTNYPVVEFRSLATKYSEHEMPELLAMAEAVGADCFTVKTLRPYDYRGRDIDNELVPLSAELARYTYESNGPRSKDDRIRINGGPIACGKPLYAPTLNSDGMVSFCSYARADNEFFGNLADTSFRALWQSREAAAKRLFFLENDGTEACASCYFRTEQKPTVIHAVPLRPFPGDLSLLRPETKDAFLSAYARGLAARDHHADTPR